MSAPSPLYLACRELIEAVDRRRSAVGSSEWAEALRDIQTAQDKIRALLAGEEP